ncbi:MAG: hypothetical protein A4E65_03102 [Syntrophorhabdus sp. PtaU1.Bin153]|nr:MAG: hypothetical protein A4E65_03102 [Syntrophorhabdus sp. PtaU1.Bin153]
MNGDDKKAFIEHLKTIHGLKEPIRGKGQVMAFMDGTRGYWAQQWAWDIEPDIKAVKSR